MELQKFASASSRGRDGHSRCMTCALDASVLKQIHDARDPQKQATLISFPVISKWLEHDQGVKIQPTTIRNHFVAGHVE